MMIVEHVESLTPEQAASWLVQHALDRGIIEVEDQAWAYNRLLESVGLSGPARPAVGADAFTLDDALDALAEVGIANGLAEDTATGRDRLAMRVAASFMPRPSEIAAQFGALRQTEGPEAATDWFYALCCDVNYVRRSAIAKNLEWITPTKWGALEITINKSKPEKDPRDIAAAGAAPAGEAYPACQLCVENEGYAGRPAAVGGGHPARQNLRIVPIELGGERWGFQYSPYAYYHEHCIAMSTQHRPMHVDRKAIGCLLDFVDLFPHYFIGSNADLPIVGGSILSHDHFQGGRHEFPMTRAKVVEEIRLAPFLSVEAGVLEWPLTVLRLACDDRDVLLEAAVYVLDAWRSWSDEEAGVSAFDEDGTPHNTVTPICRMRDGRYELDLALRCNVTSEKHPLGVFHPHEDKWHVKKENIGLIEVMGLAILPPRLEAELDAGTLTRDEIGRVFGAVLEDAGVFKWDEAGRAALRRFLDI
ncbi:MAG: UDP-glucose--hexose-1-phosphate uridylyltransferase, partial [Atopobiaceae bacterium]|nr:UDP-glucose--hexose-1-phosphate uridylyltransferase [Atopobiaceae bacterium]